MRLDLSIDVRWQTGNLRRSAKCATRASTAFQNVPAWFLRFRTFTRHTNSTAASTTAWAMPRPAKTRFSRTSSSHSVTAAAKGASAGVRP